MFMLRSLVSAFGTSGHSSRGLALVAASTCALSGAAFGQSGGAPATYEISQSSQAGGGGNSSGGAFDVAGSIGQVVAGPMQGGEFQMVGGYVPADVSSCARSDINCDGIIDGSDLGILLMMWGPCPSGAGCPGDVNSDGQVDGSDLGILLVNWG
jgi:hypothetical protein